MENITNLTREFEILQQDQNEDEYTFGGYILTFDSELLNHKINPSSQQMRLDRGATISFRRDSDNEINLPLTIDHSDSVNGVRGNFFEVFTDDVGIFGRAKTQDNDFALKIKNRTLRNFSSEVNIKKYETRNNIDYITEVLITAVSVVYAPADSKANIREFSVTNQTKITNFSDILRDFGMSNKESNIFISKFKEFLLQDKIKEIDSLKDEINKYKLLEKLRNVK